VDDLAKACLLLLEKYDENDPINVGYGSDISIMDLALLISKIVEFEGRIVWDTTKPNGTPKKLLDSSRMFNLGWQPQEALESGLKSTYNWFLENKS
jgi:GDP-L-fucose synthase